MGTIRNLKKSPVSIGTYVLRNIEVTKGREGYGYIADLYKGQNHIGGLTDYGYGGSVDFRFATNGDARKADSDMLIADMKELRALCKTPPNTLSDHWDKSPEAAAEGFGELILDFTDIYYPGDFIIISTVSNWLRPYNSGETGNYYRLAIAQVKPPEYAKLL